MLSNCAVFYYIKAVPEGSTRHFLWWYLLSPEAGPSQVFLIPYIMQPVKSYPFGNSWSSCKNAAPLVHSGNIGDWNFAMFGKLFSISNLDFLSVAALFLKIKIGSPTSNYTRSKAEFISIGWYQNKSTTMLYKPINTTQSIKERLIGGPPKTVVHSTNFDINSTIR